MSRLLGSLLRQRPSGGHLHTIRSYASTKRPLSSIDLSGVIIPLTTPFKDKDEDVAWDKLEENVRKFNQTPVKGYVVGGANGEYNLLTNEERVRAVRNVRQYSPEDRPVIAGSGCDSTAGTIELSLCMAANGADCLLVITPSYFKSQMTSAAIRKHYELVADAVEPLPIILYNMPAITGIDLNPDDVEALADIENIVGVKDSGGDITRIGKMVHQTRDKDFQVLAGSAGFLLPSLCVGAVGGICALANILPEEVCQLYQLYKDGHLDEASLLQQKLLNPNSAVTREMGPAALKTAMDWHGYYGGSPRLPLLALNNHQEELLRKKFVSSGYLQ